MAWYAPLTRLLTGTPSTVDIQLQDGRTWTPAQLEAVLKIGDLASRLDNLNVRVQLGPERYTLNLSNRSIGGLNIEMHHHPGDDAADRAIAILCEIMGATPKQNRYGDGEANTKFQIQGKYELPDFRASLERYAEKGLGQPFVTGARARNVAYDLFQQLNAAGLTVVATPKKET